MLVITRCDARYNPDESQLVLEDKYGQLPDIVITVLRVANGQARIGISADSSWNIRRGELPPQEQET